MIPEHIMLVQRSFADVLPIADIAAAMFYERLFTLDPSLRALFHRDMQAQGRMLMSALQYAGAAAWRAAPCLWRHRGAL